MSGIKSLSGLSDLMPELGQLDVPVLLVCGDSDEIAVEEMRAFQHAIPDSRLAILPDASHMNYLEQPELFKAVVSRFLKKF